MKVYEISRYLTDEQKQAILAHRYKATLSDGKGRRSADGWCPLGIAVQDEGKTPPGGYVASALTGQRVPDDPACSPDDNWLKAAQAAWEFIDAWDGGKIPPSQLPAALGVMP